MTKIIELKFLLKTSTEKVFEYLSNMQKYVSIHPVIYRIEQIGYDSFLIYEKLKFVFIPVYFTYPVIIKKDSESSVVTMEATVMKFIKIDLTFVLINKSELTIVEETIQIKSLLPITPLIKRIFKKQHELLFQNLELRVNNIQ